MYAVVNIGGKQAKVEAGSIIAVEKLDAQVGDTVSLPVLMIADGDSILVTADQLSAASVAGTVVEHFKGEKQIVFKFKKRKGYKRTKGHRQQLTNVLVTDISAQGGSKPSKAAKTEAAPKAAKAAPAPKKVEAAPKAAKTEAASKKAEAAPTEGAQCLAVKSDGTRCANKAKDGSKYCGVHAKKYEG